MSSKSSVITQVDNTALTNTSSGSIQRTQVSGSTVGSLVATKGSTINQTNTTTDMGAVAGSLNFSGDITKQLFSTLGTWANGSTSLAAAGIASANNSASNLKDAYAQASGGLSKNTLWMVGLALAAAVAAFYLRGTK